ncbi:MAG: hypothetical protein KDC43_27440 [Saprospiraceae bacterium]|nr:hypothetical protein [Saprospiraceae bacterium]
MRKSVTHAFDKPNVDQTKSDLVGDIHALLMPDPSTILARARTVMAQREAHRLALRDEIEVLQRNMVGNVYGILVTSPLHNGQIDDQPFRHSGFWAMLRNLGKSPHAS